MAGEDWRTANAQPASRAAASCASSSCPARPWRRAAAATTTRAGAAMRPSNRSPAAAYSSASGTSASALVHAQPRGGHELAVAVADHPVQAGRVVLVAPAAVGERRLRDVAGLAPDGRPQAVDRLERGRVGHALGSREGHAQPRGSPSMRRTSAGVASGRSSSRPAARRARRAARSWPGVVRARSHQTLSSRPTRTCPPAAIAIALAASWWRPMPASRPRPVVGHLGEERAQRAGREPRRAGVAEQDVDVAGRLDQPALDEVAAERHHPRLEDLELGHDAAVAHAHGQLPDRLRRVHRGLPGEVVGAQRQRSPCPAWRRPRATGPRPAPRDRARTGRCTSRRRRAADRSRGCPR